MKRLEFLLIFALDLIQSDRLLWTSLIQGSLLCALMIKKLSKIESLLSENLPTNYIVI